MGIFGVVGCLCFFLTFALVRENNLQESEKQATLKETVKSLAQNTPWKLFALNILFMWTGFFMQSAALVYYYKYYVGSTAMASLLGQLVIGLGNLNTSIIVIGAFISACGYGIKESIYFSMQADPVDYGEWKTGVQAAGTLSSVNGFLGKVAQAAAGGISGALLAWGAYDSAAAVQPANALTAIKVMYIYAPVILLVCSIITMSFYRLDKQFPQIQKELEERIAAKS